MIILPLLLSDETSFFFACKLRRYVDQMFNWGKGTSSKMSRIHQSSSATENPSICTCHRGNGSGDRASNQSSETGIRVFGGSLCYLSIYAMHISIYLTK